ncbi:MAG TPA: hypothetical protein DDW52_01225 [Planctomycetaceae bacterium]|nr:hypothetical protein [Planctomycetaceae bacterium]
MLTVVGGCGATKSYTATDQLLLSDAVDTTVSKIDFEPLRHHKVYLDVSYLKTQRSSNLIESDYVISSIRQQMVSNGVHLVESRETADVVAEARLGALGLDSHTVTYGVPSSNSLAAASSVFANAPVVPIIPELSVARHESKNGAVKIAVFAYDRETREPLWQSGIANSTSKARDTWVLGVGPFQRGTIYSRTRFAGDKLSPTELLTQQQERVKKTQRWDDYRRGRVFPALFEGSEEAENPVQLAGAENAEAQDGGKASKE